MIKDLYEFKDLKDIRYMIYLNIPYKDRKIASEYHRRR